MEVQDIEKIKRINALAKELIEHGIASNMEEAAEQAKKMIERGETVEEKKNEPNVEIRPASSASLGHGFLGLDDLKQRLDTVERQMEAMVGKINEIISELKKTEKTQENRESPITLDEPRKETQAHLKDEKKEPHPRTGKYNSDDVSIEKMFYFGGGGR